MSKNRRVHWLPGNKSSQMPTNCIWFDTESKSGPGLDGITRHQLWFGYACYQRRSRDVQWENEQWLRFDDKESFWEWVVARCRAKTRLYLFCHNGVYDLPILHAFTELPARGFRLKSAVGDAPPLILTWQNGNRVIKFLDTLNWWRLPLSIIGENIGLPKLPMPEKDASAALWEQYGKRDVEVIQSVVKSWIAFLRENDLGGFAPTLASQALGAYRHRFMPTKILIDNNHKATQLSRNSYLGARTECFRIGSYVGEYFYLDVNSMYPSVMLDGYFPHQIRGCYWRPSDKQVDGWLKECCVIAHCLVRTEEPVYPIVHEGKLVFPVGEFYCHLATPELAHAIECGHVQLIERIAVYDRFKLFAEYISSIYKMRLQAKRDGDPVNTWLFKNMLNSLYGKFGQRGRFYKTVGECDPNEVMSYPEICPDTNEVRHIRRFGGIEQVLQVDGESSNSFPAIASHVTSYARLKLYEAITLAGRQNCFYCDTDSLVVNYKGFKNMHNVLDQNALGKWKLEKRVKSMQIHGPKDYQFDGVTRTKGVRASANWLDANTVEQDQFVGLKGLLRLGSLNEPVSFKTTKTLQRVYTKGIVGTNGVVQPLRLVLPELENCPE